jgi:hypothetical protein
MSADLATAAAALRVLVMLITVEEESAEYV